jgi:hypothetical protein
MQGTKAGLYYGIDYSTEEFKTQQVEAMLCEDAWKPGHGCDSWGDAIQYELDSEEHCITFGIISGLRPDVGIFTYTRDENEARALLLAVPMDKRKHRDCNPRCRFSSGITPNPATEDVFGADDARIFIRCGIPDDTAQALLSKIADRMTRRNGRYALKPLSQAGKRVAA